MADFPFQARQDSKFYSVTPEDPAMRTTMEGGYVYSRPRHTRAPRDKFTTGFTELENAAKLTIEQFYKDMRGGSDSFNWVDPISLTSKLVRFTSVPKYQYVGINGVHLWNISSIELEEV